MKVVHVSYVRVASFRDPLTWLKRINFFVLLLSKMAERMAVESVHCISYSGTLQKDVVRYWFLNHGWLQNTLPLKMNRLIASLKPDVVLIHGFRHPWQVMLLRSELGAAVPLFIQHHSERPLKHYKQILQRRLDKHIEGYFFPSRDQAKEWIDRRQIASVSKVHEVIEAPSVFHFIDRDTARAVTKVGSGEIYLWVGRLDSNKDPNTLVKAFTLFVKQNATARLYVIYQQDDLLTQMKSLLTDEAKSRIFLVGKVPHDELLYWFNSADFIISTSHYEGMGVAVVEALSCGCIPILTSIDSFEKLCPAEARQFLFKAGDEEMLLDALVRSSKADVPSMRKMVLDAYVKNLSIETIVNTMAQVFDNVKKR